MASAHTVAAELRRRLPDLPTKKLHKLLYYCQGHHGAAFGQPLFQEPISAWDMGPVVGILWHQERAGETPTLLRELGEAELNTVGYVVSRYGALSGTDLEHLTHSEYPWKQADERRAPGGRITIEFEVIATYFRDADLYDTETATIPPETHELSSWLRTSVAELAGPGRPDSITELQSRLELHR